MKNNKGFSLVELMVVVAIIGILAAVAIPNFQRFQRKARQSEAKSLLGGLFSAEKAFYAEWQDYTSDFQHMGYSPDGQLRYRAGYGADINTRSISGYSQVVALAETADFNTNIACGTTALNCVFIGTATASMATYSVSPVDSTGANDAFLAGAAAAIGGTADDVWTINEAKLMANTVDGTTD